MSKYNYVSISTNLLISIAKKCRNDILINIHRGDVNLKNVKQYILHFIATIFLIIISFFFYDGIQNKNSYKEIGEVDLREEYAIIAGVIRNEGYGWNLIQDKTHETLGINNVEQDNDSIIIYFDEMEKVNSVAVTVDETMAEEGYHVGASVGTDRMVIIIYDRNNEKINPKKYVNNLGNIWIQGIFKK